MSVGNPPEADGRGPTPSEVSAALAAYGPAPEAFARGVKERLAASASADATPPRGARPGPGELSPPLPQRAAGLMPPGALETLLAGKLLASPHWGSALAQPWLLMWVGLAVLAAWAATRRGNLARGGRAPILLTGFGVVLLVLLGVWFLGTAWAVGLVLAAAGAAMALGAWVLGRAGIWDRERAVWVLQGGLLQGAALTMALTSQPTVGEFGPLSELASASTLAVGALALVWLAPAGRRRVLGWQASAGLVLIAGAAILIRGVSGAPVAAGAEFHRPWAEAFEAPAEDLFGWRALGELMVVWERVGTQPFPTLDRARGVLDAAGRDGLPLHPMVLHGALRAGLVEPGDARLGPIAEQLQRWRASSRLERPPLDHLDESAVLAIAHLAANGPVSPDRRAQLLLQLEALWPGPGEFHSLKRTVFALEIARALGADAAWVRGRQGSVEQILRGAWAGRTSPRVGKVGFEALAPGNEEFSPRTRSTAADTLAAVLLMERFGVPAAIDTRALDGFLATESRRGWISRWQGPLPKTLAAAQARWLLHAKLPPPPRTLGQWLRWELPFVCCFCFALVVFGLAIAVPRSGATARSQFP